MNMIQKKPQEFLFTFHYGLSSFALVLIACKKYFIGLLEIYPGEYVYYFLQFIFLDVFWDMMLDCILVVISEMIVDWIKHAFITKFNELPIEVYKDYTYSLAYDVAQTHQKHVRYLDLIVYIADIEKLLYSCKHFAGIYRPFRFSCSPYGFHSITSWSCYATRYSAGSANSRSTNFRIAGFRLLLPGQFKDCK